MSKTLDKGMNILVPILLQSIVVLLLVFFVMTNYIDNRIAGIDVGVNNPKIKILSLPDVVEKLQKNGYNEQLTTEHIEKIMSYYRGQGYLVLDLDGIITAPKGLYAEIPSVKELDAIK